MRQVLLNMVIAFLWVLFQDEESFKASTFFSGYLIGLVVIYILHRFWPTILFEKGLGSI